MYSKSQQQTALSNTILPWPFSKLEGNNTNQKQFESHDWIGRILVEFVQVVQPKNTFASTILRCHIIQRKK